MYYEDYQYFFLILFAIPFNNYAVAEIATKDATNISNDSYTNTSKAPQDDSSELLKEIYDMLLNEKDDKILILNNIINWLIGIAAILVSLISIIWGIIQYKLGKRIEEANILIKSLNDTKDKIENDQKIITNILESKEFEDKMNKINSYIQNLECKVDEIDNYYRDVREREFSQERSRDLNNISIYINLLSHPESPILPRMDSEDIEKLEKIISIEINKELLTNQELKEYVNALEELYIKYKHDGDDYSYMI